MLLDNENNTKIKESEMMNYPAKFIWSSVDTAKNSRHLRFYAKLTPKYFLFTSQHNIISLKTSTFNNTAVGS
jgi:hypothetical protein